MMPTARPGSGFSVMRAMDGWVVQRKSVVLACSALKKSYRDELCITGETQNTKPITIATLVGRSHGGATNWFVTTSVTPIATTRVTTVTSETSRP